MTQELFTLEDNEFYDENRNDLEELLSTLIDYPVALLASNSNWRGQDGAAEASDFDELLDKCLSFGNNYLDLKKDSVDGYYFRTASHDVPQGFNIYIEEI
jgi:hypothetical protein